jgi:arylsulfatase A-like enzyme
MSRSKLSQTVFLLTLLIVLATRIDVNAQTRLETDSAQTPNIIFILADDQGWNGTSVQMHPDLPNSKSDFYRTPNLEKLASQGMRFSHAYSPGPMCSPTRASLQTGKSPAQLRMTNVGGSRQRSNAASQKLILPPHSSVLRTDEVTIGETLKQAGYATAWFGKWHLGGDGPEAHGYDESDGPTGNQDGNTNDADNPKDIFGITRRGISFMEHSIDADKPFYLQLWHYAVHGPVQTNPKTEESYASRPAGQTHRSTSFAGMTEDLDTSVGMIMKKVKELGIADRTFLIYMSDHGAGRNLSSNAPLSRGKGTLWEGGLRVPLIISGPGVRPGAFCSVPTVGWDLFPTFCDLAGIEGKSIKPLFRSGKRDDDRTERPIVFHYPHYRDTGPHSTISKDGYKLIKLYDSNQLKLFDLHNDIGERNDLSQSHPEKVKSMHQSLMEYLENVNAGVPATNPDFDPSLVPPTGRLVPQSGGSTRRPGGSTRRPGGSGARQRGRRGPSPAQIAERQKELTHLEQALKQNDMDTVGRMIAEMNRAASESQSPRRPRRGNAGAESPRQRRQQELKKLDEAYKKADVQQLAELVEGIKTRLENDTSRTSTQPRIAPTKDAQF